MRLEFSGAPEIAAPREKVWGHLLDPNFVAACAPGVESVEAVDPTHFKVISGLGVGAVQVKFKLDVELFDMVEPERLKMAARGKAPGSAVDVVSSLRARGDRERPHPPQLVGDQQCERHRGERRRSAPRGHRPAAHREVLDRLRPACQRRVKALDMTGPADHRRSAGRLRPHGYVADRDLATVAASSRWPWIVRCCWKARPASARPRWPAPWRRPSAPS